MATAIKVPKVVLFAPLIPGNTGTVGRLVASLNGELHLVKPLGFSLDDAKVKRAGLDYWPHLNLRVHESLDEVLSGDDMNKLDDHNVAFISKFGERPYTEMPASVHTLVFGQETTGLRNMSPALRARFADNFYHIPMYNPHVRSINLACAVAAVLYGQLQRLAAPGTAARP